MERSRPYRFDSEGPSLQKEPDGRTLRARPWIGVRFDCCSVYVRVYRNAEGTAYHGRCPRCLRTVRFVVSPDGIDARFFVAE